MARENHNDASPDDTPKTPNAPSRIRDPVTPLNKSSNAQMIPKTPTHNPTGGKSSTASRSADDVAADGDGSENEDFASDEADEDEDEDEDDEEDQDEEPKLKYQRLTPNLSSVYRNGDATSSFIVGGDKMILGTHNGNIVVLTLPNLQPLRTYHAHSASITCVSASPFPLPFPTLRHDHKTQLHPEPVPSSPAQNPVGAKIPPSPRTPKQSVVPATPSNSIYIATSSIDGHVCVASLVDPKDVTLRNFARPVSAVALSPDYKSDRAYISGGLAGNLILTVGGKAGVSSNANTNSAAAAASGWLSSIGIGSQTGSDKILHSGEGSISAIKWSLSGKFVVWVNEHGIKIMRTSSKLESSESELAWTRIGHIDRPTRSNWNVMAAVWKARVEWVDESGLENDDEIVSSQNGGAPGTPTRRATDSLHTAKTASSKKKKHDTLVVGWGDTIWVVHVRPEHHIVGKDNITHRTGGSATILHHLLFDDCIVSGVSLYTPSLLLILAYRTRDDEDKPLPVTTTNTPRRGVHNRQTGLSPELRLINVNTKEEIDVDTLTMSRYESLSAADYHLNTLRVPVATAIANLPRSTLEALGGLGGGLWDASLNATRIFSSAASIRSGVGSVDNTTATPQTRQSSISRSSPIRRRTSVDPLPNVAAPGLKVFVQSPYDCVLALKRDLYDHLEWLVEHHSYQRAWELVCEHPEVIPIPTDDSSVDEGQRTPTGKGQTLADFFADDSASQTTISVTKSQKQAVERESQRIGELWIQQLIDAGDWVQAGQVAGRVLGSSPTWEQWVWKFAQAGKFDEITPYIPNKPTRPRIPSVVYERILGHYLNHNRLKFKDLIDRWDVDLFDAENITNAIETNLNNGNVEEDSIQSGIQGRDWRILLDVLARLKVADGRPKEALKYYIKLQNADAAMAIIKDSHLVESIADDVPGFLMLRVSKEQLDGANLSELEEHSTEAIRMLSDESISGAIDPEVVVNQLQKKGDRYKPFLFLYLRNLWIGRKAEGRSRRLHETLEYGGRNIVEQFGDLAVRVFTANDRTILLDFLRQSRSYSFEQATSICEEKQFYPELVYLFSQTGQTKRALNLIINSLGDVKFAISFAKEQEDPELWDDLLEFSMDKPSFIRGLLEEVGTAIDPIKLVRRIPEGLEIEGLRDGVGKMVREYEIQASISEGVARVLRSEVAIGMESLRNGRARGIKFHITEEDTTNIDVEDKPSKDKVKFEQTNKSSEENEAIGDEPKPGHCVSCGQPFDVTEKGILIGFPCGHVYHLSCIIAQLDDDVATSTAQRLQSQLVADEDQNDTRSVGAKMAHAHLIKSIVDKGCSRCKIQALVE